MPNWCLNDLTIHGSKSEVKTFLEKILTNGKLDFNKLIPEPLTKEECPPAFICDCKKESLEVLNGRDWFNWYEWRCRFWGTKWNACESNVEIENSGKDNATATINFDTAWSPAEGVLEKIFNKIPGKVELTIRCYGEIDGEFEANRNLDGSNDFKEEFNYDFYKLKTDELNKKDLTISKEIEKFLYLRSEGEMSGYSYDTFEEKGINRKDLEMYVKRNSLEECLEFDNDNGELAILDEKRFVSRFDSEVFKERQKEFEDKGDDFSV